MCKVFGDKNKLLAIFFHSAVCQSKWIVSNCNKYSSIEAMEINIMSNLGT